MDWEVQVKVRGSQSRLLFLLLLTLSFLGQKPRSHFFPSFLLSFISCIPSISKSCHYCLQNLSQIRFSHHFHFVTLFPATRPPSSVTWFIAIASQSVSQILFLLLHHLFSTQQPEQAFKNMWDNTFPYFKDLQWLSIVLQPELFTLAVSKDFDLFVISFSLSRMPFLSL